MTGPALPLAAMEGEARPCPVCGRAPDIDECGPLPPGEPPIWTVNCHTTIGKDNEHFVGANGDTRAEAIEEWNREAARLSASLEPEKG